ncbi:MAG: hypothetical protein JXA11_06105 [Phycisphaerae bacterium]|nr:hypothetical protein [Phycisphaerae bacterium]
MNESGGRTHRLAGPADAAEGRLCQGFCDLWIRAGGEKKRHRPALAGE